MKLRKLAAVCDYFDGVIGNVEVWSADDQLYFELPEALRFTQKDLDHLSEKFSIFVEKCEDDEHVKTFSMFV
jgi:hypothetical protein